MDPILITALLIGLITLLLFYSENRKPKRYPTGPVRFPLLGNLPQLWWQRAVNGKNRGEIYQEYSKKFGSLFAMKIGPFNSIVLNEPKLIKEAWSNYELCGRPKLDGAAVRTGGTVRGILFQDGVEWVEQRRFALRHLRDFGFGKRSMEALVMDEVQELIEGLKKEPVGVAISTQNRFNIAVLNSLWRIITGQRFSHDDQELVKIMKSINKSLTFPGFIFFFPWIKDLIPQLSGWEQFVKEILESTQFVTSFVKDRLQTFDGQQEAQDFTDVYIQEIKKTTDISSSFYGKRGEETLTGTLLDLFVAGAETTSTTLTFVFLYMAIFPDKQENVRQEIDQVLGTRNPTLEDRSKMPYTEAVLYESLRYSSMVPLGIFHKALSDTVLGDYIIPKGTFITANLYSVHFSEEIWGDPNNFRPERFLSPDKQKVIKNENLIAFSYGKRVCLGEALAKDELFLFVTSLLQHFTVGPDPNATQPLTTDQVPTNIISPPKAHKLIFKSRF